MNIIRLAFFKPLRDVGQLAQLLQLDIHPARNLISKKKGKSPLEGEVTFREQGKMLILYLLAVGVYERLACELLIVEADDLAHQNVLVEIFVETDNSLLGEVLKVRRLEFKASGLLDVVGLVHSRSVQGVLSATSSKHFAGHSELFTCDSGKNIFRPDKVDQTFLCEIDVAGFSDSCARGKIFFPVNVMTRESLVVEELCTRERLESNDFVVLDASENELVKALVLAAQLGGHCMETDYNVGGAIDERQIGGRSIVRAMRMNFESHGLKNLKSE